LKRVLHVGEIRGGRWLMGVGALAISVTAMNTTRPADATGLLD